MNELVRVQGSLPPVLLGSVTPENRERIETFFFSVASIFEAWVNRRKSEHTRRAYRGDVMAFVQFMEWKWPEDSITLLSSSILDVQAWKNRMVEESAAPKTINRRISSLSSFFKFLAGAAARQLMTMPKGMNSCRCATVRS
jgi:site-specific recombinase XerD